MRERAEAALGRSLRERAQLAAGLVGDSLRARPADQLDAVADRAARAANAHVTLVAPDGSVVGDSQLPVDRLRDLGDLGGLPELRAALAGQVGESQRRTGRAGRRLLYVAVPLEGGGALRLEADLAEVEEALWDLRRRLLLAGLLALAGALGTALVLSWLSARPLEQMREVAKSLARGDLEPRLPMRATDELGEISHALNAMAERLRTQLDETTAEKERLQAVLNAMAEGVLVVDAQGEILLANERLRQLFGLRGDLRGRSALAVVRGPDFEQLLRDAGRTDASVSCEIEGSGGRYLQVQAVRFPSGDGPRAGTVAVFHDLTEIQRLEQVRRDFVANASHELRTPLAAIQGFAETLLHKPDLPEKDRLSYLEIVERQALRLGRIVDDLLDLSEAEREDVPLELTDVRVGELAASLVADAKRRHGDRLTIELAAPDGSTAWADPQAVEQILQNLLDNAIKYTEAGGRIELRIAPSDPWLEIRVADTGIGIPEDDLSRIFERFYRVDRARSRALGGTGLGLSIVKHLVHRMGGEISVESVLGQGSVFRFTLPQRPPPAGPRT